MTSINTNNPQEDNKNASVIKPEKSTSELWDILGKIMNLPNFKAPEDGIYHFPSNEHPFTESDDLIEKEMSNAISTVCIEKKSKRSIPISFPSPDKKCFLKSQPQLCPGITHPLTFTTVHESSVKLCEIIEKYLSENSNEEDLKTYDTSWSGIIRGCGFRYTVYRHREVENMFVVECAHVSGDKNFEYGGLFFGMKALFP